MKKKNIDSTDIKNALNENNVGKPLASGVRIPETLPKIIFGILLIITGIMIAVITSISVIGILIGAAFVIGGLILPFSNIGIGRRHTA